MKKITLSILIFLIIVLAISVTTHAATHCVSPSGSGSKTGADWNNAYANIPASLVRGDTYYIADGSYGNHTFGDAVSGTTAIVIRKATAADHGVDTGWNNSYGAGQAVFGSWRFAHANSGYYEFEGYSAAVTKGCGIKVQMPLESNLYSSGAAAIIFGGGSTANFPYMTFKYLEVSGPYSTGTYSSSLYRTGIFFSQNDGSNNTSHSTVSHCWIHNGCTTPIADGDGNSYLTIEYCELCDMNDTGGIDHADVYVVASNNGIFRYNYCHNYVPCGLFMQGGTSVSGFQVYGNVFDGGGKTATQFITCNTGCTLTNWQVYNNTIVDVDSPFNLASPSVIGCKFYNNLFCGHSGSGGSGWDTQNSLTVSSSVFVNYAGKDFHLQSHTTSGTTLSSPYNIDMDGVTRVPGSWDIGAYEYVAGGGGITPPSPPNNLRMR